MKKIYLSLLLVSYVQTTFAQQWTGSANLDNLISRNGNIQVNGLYYGRYGSALSGDSNPYLINTADNESHDLTVFGSNAGTLHLRMYDGDIKLGSYSNPNSIIYNNGGAYFIGSVGIGTTSLDSKLTVLGGSKFGNVVSTPGYNDHVVVRTDGGTAFEGGQIFTNVDNTSGYGIKMSASYSVTSDPHFRIGVVNQGNPNTFTKDYLYFKSGNVGIGTTNPTQKLEVNGTIYSKEVKVDLSAGTGPDYVFEPDYKLLSLEEIKSYIDQHKHLPEVPSAKEMEANGVNVSEMNMLLLKKIEELTLHSIELKKITEDQNKKIEFLLKEIETLKTK